MSIIPRRLGAIERPGKGSHVRFTIGTCNTTVPNHRGEDLARFIGEAAAATLLTWKFGLSVRDAAELLGVSYQRIQQLAGARR